LLLLCVAAFSGFGCSSKKIIRCCTEISYKCTCCEMAIPPDWIKSYPKDKNYIYALGYYNGPEVEGADYKIEKAMEDAYDNMVYSIDVFVKNAVFESNGNVQTITQIDLQRMNDMKEKYVDNIKSAAKKEKSWVDVCGCVSREAKGAVYVLIKMQK